MKLINYLANYRKLSLDVVALSGAHISRYLLVYLTIPYLARMLGVEELGVFLFFQAYGMIVTQIVEFGYALFGTKKVALNVENEEERSRLFCNIIFSQLLIFCLILVPSISMFWFFPQYENYYLIGLIAVFNGGISGMNLFWYFRAIGKSILVAKVELAGKLIILTVIFSFVKQPSDLIIVVVAYFCGNLFSLIVSLTVVQNDIKLITPQLDSIYEMIRNAWYSFLIRAGGSLISDGNVILCGAILPAKEFGYFSAAYRIANAIRGLFTPIVDAIFPRLSVRIENSNKDLSIVYKRIFPLMLFIGLGLAGSMFVFAELIVLFMLGSEFSESVLFIKYFSLLPFIIAIVHTFGTQCLVPIGLDKTYSKIVLFSGAVGLIVSYVLTPHYSSEGAIFSIILSYGLVAIFSVYATKPFGIKRQVS